MFLNINLQFCHHITLTILTECPYKANEISRLAFSTFWWGFFSIFNIHKVSSCSRSCYVPLLNLLQLSRLHLGIIFHLPCTESAAWHRGWPLLPKSIYSRRLVFNGKGGDNRVKVRYQPENMTSIGKSEHQICTDLSLWLPYVYIWRSISSKLLKIAVKWSEIHIIRMVCHKGTQECYINRGCSQICRSVGICQRPFTPTSHQYTVYIGLPFLL